MQTLRVSSTAGEQTNVFEYDYEGLFMADVLIARIQKRLQDLLVGVSLQDAVLERLKAQDESSIGSFQFEMPGALQLSITRLP